jgi:hypothetical protein
LEKEKQEMIEEQLEKGMEKVPPSILKKAHSMFEKFLK